MHLPRVFAFGSLAFVLAIHYGDKAQGKESPFALSSGVGFNWLDPESAHCARIAAAESRKFKACEFRDSGAFGLAHAYYSCPTDDGAEFLVFKSVAECQEALETMQANAP